MRRQTIWMAISLTILLTLSGCGETQSQSQSNQSMTGNTTSISPGDQPSSSTMSKDGAASDSSTGDDSHPRLSNKNEVMKAIRTEVKMKNVVLPSSFPLAKDRYLGAVITKNTSDALYVNFYSTDQPVSLNDPSLKKSDGENSWLASYEVKTDADPNSTDIFPETDLQNIPKDMSVELGYGIKGLAEGAAGSQYLTWQEGRWTLQIRSRSEDQMNNPGIAKKMVKYLESHRLPAPKDKGLVHVQYTNGGDQVRVTISWQDGERIHQLKTDHIPLDALRMVVSVK
ncbi:hypothetical protein PAECIP112173_00958 [Paenibacillus sp. JJ-100]|uniref:hypothetical protein n=1 Tax=Paenibacillus sp. JJ-100 TaxID=2974896 RepID=UPI0022FF5A55|nr:hypothetical protein [Paenibacillus sp. JJ-100]CAI6039609.1 hypothetical protein PAECIP112173_00958 [Paenibacillus sp. JJ-100]